MVRFGDSLGEHAQQYSGLIAEDRYLDYEHLKDLIYNAPEAFLDKFVEELGKLRHFLEGAAKEEDHCQPGCPCRIPEQHARMHFMRMNREGCRKILKKYDKRTANTAGPSYMAKVDNLLLEYISEEDFAQVKEVASTKQTPKVTSTRQDSSLRVNNVYATIDSLPVVGDDPAAAPHATPPPGTPLTPAWSMPANHSAHYAPQHPHYPHTPIYAPLPPVLHHEMDPYAGGYGAPHPTPDMYAHPPHPYAPGYPPPPMGGYAQSPYDPTITGIPLSRPVRLESVLGEDATAASDSLSGHDGCENMSMHADPHLLGGSHTNSSESLDGSGQSEVGGEYHRVACSALSDHTPAPAPPVRIRWLDCNQKPIGLLSRSVAALTVKNTTKIKVDRQVIHTTQDYLVLDPHNKGRYLIPAALVDETAGKRSYGMKKQSFVCMLHQKGGSNGHRGCNARHSCNQMHVSKEAIAMLRKVAEEEDGYTVAVEGNFVVELRSVHDPVTGLSFVFPFHRTEHTAGRLAYAKAAAQCRRGEGPAPEVRLCVEYLSAQCPHGKACAHIHAEPPYVAQLRDGNPCCPRHRPDRCAPLDAEVSIRMALPPSSSRKETVEVPLDLVTVTRGLTSLPVKQSKSGAYKCFASGKLCRLHAENRCEFGTRCNNIHVCRDYTQTQIRERQHTQQQQQQQQGQGKDGRKGGQKQASQQQQQQQQRSARSTRCRKEVQHNPYIAHPPIRMP